MNLAPSQVHAQALARCLGQPLFSGNRVERLAAGAPARQALLDAIDAAAQHINIDSAVVCEAAPLAQLLQRLIARRRAGVRVNVLEEKTGALPALQALAGRALQLCPQRRLAIIDGRCAFVGGDAPLRVDGPAVGELQQQFIARWHRFADTPLAPARYFPALEPAGTQRIGVAARGAGRHSFARALLGAIEAAQRRVLIGGTGLLPAQRLATALAAAARRGVEMHLQPGPNTAFVVDGVWTALGTSDLGWRGWLHDGGSHLIVLDAAFAADVELALRAGAESRSTSRAGRAVAA